MLSRLWLLVSLGWVGFCLWAMSPGELRHLSLENAGWLSAPFLIRLAVLFIVYGIPRASVTAAGRRSPR
jgi:hypothetical protein